MKNLTTIIFFAAIHLCHAQSEKRIKPDIKSAVLYFNQASIHAEARFEVEAGQNKIVLVGLPNNLSQDAIQLKPKGDITIQEVYFRNNTGRLPSKTKELSLLEDSLSHYQSESDSINNFIEALQIEQKLIVSNMQIKGENTGVKAIELEDIADFYRERLPQISNLINKLAKKREKINEKLARLRAKVVPLQNDRNKLTGELVAIVNANAKVPAVFDLSYISYEAGWQPTYDWKIKSVKEPLSLVYKASAFQHTGQDWNHIKLSFSTSQPSNISNLPVLPDWRLSFDYPKPIMLYGDMKRKSAAAPARAEEEITMEVSAYFSNVQETNLFSGTILEYALNTPVNLPTDSISHSFELKSATVNAEYKFIAVPKLQSEVFVTAYISAWESLNLVPSQTSVYVENAFIGNSYIDPNATGDTLKIPLFTDKNIVVTRALLTDLSSRKFIGTNTKQEFGFLITLKNNNKESVDLVLQDQIPVSNDGQIEVEYANETNADWNKSTGKLEWKLNLGPTESKKIMLKYSVKYPKDKRVRGL